MDVVVVFVGFVGGCLRWKGRWWWWCCTEEEGGGGGEVGGRRKEEGDIGGARDIVEVDEDVAGFRPVAAVVVDVCLVGE